LSVNRLRIAPILLAAGLVAGCTQANLWFEERSADQFAQTAFEKFRARELRQLPLSNVYDEKKIREAEETVAAYIPSSAPTSSQLTQVEIASDTLALVRRQYAYPGKALEVSVGMERDTRSGPWKLYGLSVTPATTAR